MTEIKYKEGQSWRSIKYPDMIFTIVEISSDRKNIKYLRFDVFENIKKIYGQETRLSTFIKRLQRNEMELI